MKVYKDIGEEHEQKWKKKISRKKNLVERMREEIIL